MAESPTPKPQPGSLKTSCSPVLEGALANLMVDLDDELQRYRQRRSDQSGLSTSAPQTRFGRAQRSGPQLINLPAAPAAATKVAPGTTTEVQTPACLPEGRPMPPPPPPRSALTSHDLIPYSPGAEDYLESTEALLDTDPTAYITDYGSDPEDPSPALGRTLATPLGLGALLLLLLASAGFGYLVTSPQAVDHLRQHPLIRGLGQKVQPPAVISNPEPGVSGPEGLGPDLSEQEFTQLDLNRLSNLPSSTPDAPPSIPPSNSALDQERLQPSPRPSPTLQKPVDLPSVTPAPSPQGVAPARPTGSSPSRPPSPTPAVVSSAPPTSAPATTPTPVKVAPSGQSAPPPPPLMAPTTPRPPAPLSQVPSAPAPLRPSPRYYVVVDYSGDASLAAARQVVGDAYVRNFSTGARIQMGAFSQPAAAQSLVQQLQQQGISAQVITP